MFTGRAFADDASDAKSVAINFFQAIEANDDTFINAHFAGGPSDTKLLFALRESITDSAEFRAACEKQFGLDNVSRDADLFNPQTLSAAIQQCDALVHSDIARLRNKETNADSLVLWKTAGTWKVVSLTGTPGQTAQLRAFLATFLPALKQTTPEVAQGKYVSMAEVHAAIADKIRQVVIIPSTTVPTTKP